jgi:hypothetical protein
VVSGEESCKKGAVTKGYGTKFYIFTLEELHRCRSLHILIRF